MSAKEEKMIPCIMTERIVSIEQKVSSLPNMEQSLKNIEIAIAGSENLGLEGFAKRLHKQERITRSHQKIIWAGLGIIGFIAGALELYRTFAQ